MTHRRFSLGRSRTLLALGALGLTFALTGCLSTTKYPPVKVYTPPPTPDVLAVKNSPAPAFTPEQQAKPDTLGERFLAWKVCRPETNEWSLAEEGVVLFGCSEHGPGTYLFRWTITKDGVITLKSVTHMGQDDAEWAGVEFRHQEAQSIFDAAMKNDVPDIE